MTVRIDKWLCASRFFKTRGLASTEILNGRVLLNGERVKPAKKVDKGDRLEIRKGPYRFRVEILGLAEKRLSAPLAQELYLEDEQSVAEREQVAASLKEDRAMSAWAQRHGRPTKRERRQMNKFRGS